MNWASAVTLCRDLQRGDVSSVDVTNEVYERISRTNESVNALVNLIPRERALELASAADDVPFADRGPLHGLPWATKDAVEVDGFPTTWGFRPWAENYPKQDDAQAARLRAAGVIFIGRSNMPEFGLGSNTFNDLFGTTLNPYDPDKTCGGSSGGAAVALATEMLPLADGSDMGGSLRNPASFCNVVGLRPSIGRVPNGRGFAWLSRLTTTGPMAKTVADTALLFSVMAGPDATDPLTLPEPGHSFLDALVPLNDLAGLTIGYAPQLNNLPIDPSVLSVISQCADVMASLGATISNEIPPLHDAMDVFQTQRAAGLATMGDALDQSIPDWKKYAKDTAVWNIEKGQQLNTRELLKSEIMRAGIYRDIAAYFEHHDALILPAAQVPPFASSTEWVAEIDGTKLDTYLDWMTVCCAITVTGLPAISVPGGFTPEGLPVGLQIVGKPRGDLALLRIAHTFEQATQHYKNKPAIISHSHT